MSTIHETSLSIFPDDTSILVLCESATTASKILEDTLDKIQEYFKKWKINVKKEKPNHITFILKKQIPFGYAKR